MSAPRTYMVEEDDGDKRVTRDKFPPADEITTRLCQLVEKVAAEAYRNEVPTDCFCGNGGNWRQEPIIGRRIRPAYWRHNDVAIRFIEEAVEERLRRIKRLDAAADRLKPDPYEETP